MRGIVRVFIADDREGRRERPDAFLILRKDVCDHPDRRCLAIGTGDADNCQLPSREARAQRRDKRFHPMPCQTHRVAVGEEAFQMVEERAYGQWTIRSERKTENGQYDY